MEKNKPFIAKFTIAILCFISCTDTYCQTIIKDTLKLKGSISATGLIQTGDENRKVFSLLSDLTIGTKQWEAEPLTSIAYSDKPGKQVEGEYLQNIILRYHQNKKFYPAIGFDIEQSFLRKIDMRWNVSAVLVYNLLKLSNQKIKIGLGYSHEFSKYKDGAFLPAINGDNVYSRNVEQVYLRIKGICLLAKNFTVGFDIFSQHNLNDLSDSRQFIIGNLDYSITKHFQLRASGLFSHESFVATNVSNNNFRMTYGLNYKF